MSAPFDETDFVDRELQAGQRLRGSAAIGAAPVNAPVAARPPTREELETKVGEAQTQIAELRRAQEQLERERTALEEARRRRLEFENGRGEMRQHLTRGVGLLEKAEFEARRDAEQMAKTLTAFREALANVEALNEQAWTQENWSTELTRALTTLENARMEWNGARLKWKLLDPDHPTEPSTPSAAAGSEQDLLRGRSFLELCRLGFALTWPLAGVALLAAGALLIVLLRR